VKRPGPSSLEARYEIEVPRRRGTDIGSDVGVRLGVNGVDYVRVRPKGTCLTKDQLRDGANREDGRAPLYGTRRVVEVDMMVAQLSWGAKVKDRDERGTAHVGRPVAALAGLGFGGAVRCRTALVRSTRARLGV
jgi:hypothetical protein